MSLDSPTSAASRIALPAANRMIGITAGRVVLRGNDARLPRRGRATFWPNVEIVGTELRSVEQVTRRPIRGRIAAAGALSGLWIRPVGDIAFNLFSNQNQLGNSTTTRYGTRDVASVSRVVATRYEVLVQHKRATRARELLARNATGGDDLRP